jgi:hypothetical protein
MSQLPYTNLALQPELKTLLEKLRPGMKVRITQTVRVGSRSWPAVATGVFHHVDSLATGIATDRVPEDDVVVPLLHFTKDPHGELSSVTFDENTKIEIISN